MKVYFVDLDDTLLDTSGFKDRMFRSIYKLSGLNIKKLKNFYEELRFGGQLKNSWLSDYIKKISLISLVPESSLTDTIFGLIKTMKVNRKLLHYLMDIKATKYILTVGDKKFQKSKIDHFGFTGYFDGVIYVPGQKCDFLLSRISGNRLKIMGKNYDEVEIIDDKVRLLECLKMFNFIKITDPKYII